MLELVAIAIGGALGAVVRSVANNFISGFFSTDFPFGILIVNITGSFLMGICFELLAEENLFGELPKQLLMVGFLGAFTTFSTFSLQIFALLESGRVLAAALYILSSVLLSVIALASGIFMLRELNT